MKIGYKATNNMRCESLTYEIGKKYKISSMKMCKHGFHYCNHLDDTLNYYIYNKDIVFIKIEVLGKIQTKDDKSVTDHIRVLGVVDKSELQNCKYDEHGNMIYRKNSYGDEYHWGYDEHGNKIYQKDPDGDEYHWGYDEHGNKIYQKDSYDYEYHWEYRYDEHGNKIYKKTPYGDEYHWGYDEHGNKIYQKDPDGVEWKIEII
jgi:YD repeat-containing protein